MAAQDRARKLIVRTVLVTSTTVATLFGAQNFALLDALHTQADNTSLIISQVEQTSLDTQSPDLISPVSPEITIQNTSPNLTILRRSGSSDPLAQDSTEVNAVPVQPAGIAQIAAPEPVVVQQPVPQRTRSTR